MPGRKASEATRREQILRAAYRAAAQGGIDGLTVRAVAAHAELSHGLILFHFKRKDQLVGALLERVLATTATLHIPDDVARMPRAPDRLDALLRQEIDRLSRNPRRTRLFFDYWVLGTRDAAIRSEIGAALARYRDAFRDLIAQVLRDEPPRHGEVTAEGAAAGAVSLIYGCVVQAVADPERFDAGACHAAAREFIARLSEVSLPPTRGPRAGAARPAPHGGLHGGTRPRRGR